MRIYTSTRPIVDDDRRDFAHELDARAAVMIACGLLEAGKYYFNLREYHNDVKLAEIKRDALLAAYDADAPHDPRTPEQRDRDEWEADTRRTMEDARPL